MIKKFLKQLSIKTTERELVDYVHKISVGSSEQRGIILSHACLIFAQVIKKAPEMERIITEKDDVYSEELTGLVLQTNGLLKEYADAEETLNAAGIKLWNETFRCLVYPELTNYGKKIWFYFTQAQEDAKEYLDSLEERFVEQENDNMLKKIKEARKYLLLVPERYKQ